MSASVDVNLLLYASDQKSPFHRKAVTFLEGASSGNLLYIAWPTITSFGSLIP